MPSMNTLPTFLICKTAIISFNLKHLKPVIFVASVNMTHCNAYTKDTHYSASKHNEIAVNGNCFTANIVTRFYFSDK